MSNELVAKARKMIEEGNFDQALVTLRRLEAENPQDPSINQLLGHLAYRSGDAQDAEKRLSKACEIFEDRGEIIPAIGCLEELVAIEAEPRRVVALANLYIRIGLKNEAQSRLFNKADDCIRTGDEENGLKILGKICELESENIALRLIYGKMLMFSGRKEIATEYLNNLRNDAVAKSDNDVVTEIDSMLAEQDGGEELDPKSRVELANLLSEIGSAQEAISEYFIAASDLIEMDKTHEAREVLKRILDIDPENKRAKEELEKLIPEEEEEEEESPEEIPEEELEEVAVAAETDTGEEPEEETEEKTDAEDVPDIENIEGQVADIEFLLKEVEAKPEIQLKLRDLLEDFRQKMRPFSENPNIRFRIGNEFAQLSLLNLAIKNYEKMLDNPEYRSRAIERLGTTYIRAGKYNEALRYLAEVIVQQPDNLDIRYDLVRAYQGMGDHENALNQLSTIMEINPDYRDVRDLYRLIGGKEEETKAEVGEFREDIGGVAQKAPPAYSPEEKTGEDNIVFI